MSDPRQPLEYTRLPALPTRNPRVRELQGPAMVLPGIGMGLLVAVLSTIALRVLPGHRDILQNVLAINVVMSGIYFGFRGWRAFAVGILLADALILAGYFFLLWLLSKYG